MVLAWAIGGIWGGLGQRLKLDPRADPQSVTVNAVLICNSAHDRCSTRNAVVLEEMVDGSGGPQTTDGCTVKYVHTYVGTYVTFACRLVLRTYLCTYVLTYLCTYVRTYIHMYYVHMCVSI